MTEAELVMQFKNGDAGLPGYKNFYKIGTYVLFI